MRHKSRLCAHQGMQQWGVNYWGNYVTVVNRISVRSLLDIKSIHALLSRLIYFVLDFHQVDLDVDVFVDLPLGMKFDRNREKLVLM